MSETKDWYNTPLKDWDKPITNNTPDGSENFIVQEGERKVDDKLYSFLFKTLAMLDNAESIAVIIGNSSREFGILPDQIVEWARTREYSNSLEEKQMHYNADLIDGKLSNMGYKSNNKSKIR